MLDKTLLELDEEERRMNLKDWFVSREKIEQQSLLRSDRKTFRTLLSRICFL